MKIHLRLLPILLAATILSGCGNSAENEPIDNNSENSAGIESIDSNDSENNAGTESIENKSDENIVSSETLEDPTEENTNNNEANADATAETANSNEADQATPKHLTVAEDIDVSYVKDADAAAIFKDFLLNKTSADHDGNEIFLENMLIDQIDDYDYDSETETMTEYLVGNYAISYVISEVDEPVLYIEIMNVMVGGSVYQLKTRGSDLYVNNVIGTGWSDSVSVYPNGLISLYHGMHLPVIQYYYDGRDSLIDVYDNSNKVQLIVVGPKSYFDTDFEEAKAEYEKQADTVLFFEDESFEDTAAQRDEILGLAADDDMIMWNKVTVVNFEE